MVQRKEAICVNGQTPLPPPLHIDSPIGWKRFTFLPVVYFAALLVPFVSCRSAITFVSRVSLLLRCTPFFAQAVLMNAGTIQM